MTTITSSRKNGGARPKGYINQYRPQRKTRALLNQVLAVLDEYRDHLPLTERQVFYRLVGVYKYPKTAEASARLSTHLTNARRARVIPFTSLRDDGVVVMRPQHWYSEDSFLFDMQDRAERFTLDKLANQDVYIEVLCEAAGMQPQLAAVAAPYSIPVYASGGFDSVQAKWELAQRLAWKFKPCIVLHVGDYDPSGVSMFDSMAEDVTAFVEADKRDGFTSVTFVRVALTKEQVHDYRLDTAPPNPNDKRSRRWRGNTCQLEALAPDALAAILRDAMERQLDLAQIEADKAEQVRIRQRLTRLLSPPNGTAEGGAQ
jgi:hypothetical protein